MKFFTSGLEMEIYAITEGRVLSYLLDPEFESKLPIIPSEVSYVNFTWKSGVKRYTYNFYQLQSLDETILKTPSITIKAKGRVPKRPKGKQLFLSIILFFNNPAYFESKKSKVIRRHAKRYHF